MAEIVHIHGIEYEVCECLVCGVIYTAPHAMKNIHRREGVTPAARTATKRAGRETAAKSNCCAANAIG